MFPGHGRATYMSDAANMPIIGLKSKARATICPITGACRDLLFALYNNVQLLRYLLCYAANQ